MSTITVPVPTRNQLTPEGQAVYDQLQKAFGKVPNLFATIGWSHHALGAYLTFQSSLEKGAFNAKERQAIYLAVSQVNECVYCQAAHTTLGKMAGLTEEETRQIRAGVHPDSRLNAIARLAAAVQANHGRVAPELVSAFYAEGFDHAALIELISLVADKALANYVHNLTQVPVDFPAAKPIDDLITVS